MTLAAISLVTACGGNPVQPASAPQPVAARPSNTNSPPVIRSISIRGQRAEADDEVAVTADVEDAETPTDQLMYQWSVAPDRGRFIGSGREVVWKAPREQPTPDTYTVSLSVIERYTFGGELRENRTSSSQDVHYNDSHEESGRLALDFLRDFANPDVAPEQVVRHFSDSCPGKLAELQAVKNNRRDYQVLGGDFSVALTGLYDNRTVGEIVAPCSFRSMSKATGRMDTTSGTCNLTSVYEDWRWQLCESRFSAMATGASSSTHP